MAVEKEAEKSNSDSGKESRREQNVEFVWAYQHNQEILGDKEFKEFKEFRTIPDYLICKMHNAS